MIQTHFPNAQMDLNSASYNSQDRRQVQPKRLRSACDNCHRSKIRCTGGKPCRKCSNRYVAHTLYTLAYFTPACEDMLILPGAQSSLECIYSYVAKLGKPKGARNKKTLERLNQMALEGSTSEEEKSGGQNIKLEQVATGSTASPSSMTQQWMELPEVSSIYFDIGADINLSLEIPRTPSTCGLDAFFDPLSIDESLQQVCTSRNRQRDIAILKRNR